MSTHVVRFGRGPSSASRRSTFRARAFVTGLLAVGGLVVVPATAAEAATPGCPPGTPSAGGRTFIGGPENNHIVGTPGDDYICAGAGNDYVDGGGGNDRIYGGPGNDDLRGGSGADWIEGGAGSDTIRGGTGSDHIYADAGPAYENAPVATSEAGNDVVWGDAGSDVIDAGPGNDIVFPGGDGERANGGDVVHGGPGNDAVIANPLRPSFTDSFFGDDGDDVLWPNPLRSAPLGNTVWGGKGNDLIITVNAQSDGVELGEPKGVKIPLGNSGCSVTIPVLRNAPIGSPGAVNCKFPKLGAYTLSVTTGSGSKVSIGGPLRGLMTKLTVTDLRKLTSGGFSGDICLCDPEVRGWPYADRVDK